MVQLSEKIVDIIVKYAKNLGFKKAELKVSNGSKNGDSFSGDVSRVLVQETVGFDRDMEENINCTTTFEHQPPALHLIVKTPPANETRRQMYNSAASFNRESYVYEHIIPAFTNFQAARLTTSNQIFDKYPCLVAASCESNNEFLILGDLIEEGFKNAPKSSPLDFDRAALVLVNLAHFHAISFAMRDQNPEMFSKMTATLKETVFSQPVHEHMQTFLAKQVDYALTTLADDELVLREKLLEFQKDFGQIMADITHNKEDAVVTHGDCWISNIMFHEKRADLKFLDWQVSRLGSVVIDIAYFIFCCTDENLRKQLPDLLKIYHKALANRIEALGSHSSRLFSFERLEAHMGKFAKFGLGMALMTLHTTCCAELPMDVTETLDNIDMNQFESIAMQLIFRPEYKERMGGVARDMLKFGYL